MDLSSEDALRLNVLLANRPLAIRIDESAMVLYGLTEKGEVKVSLNPNCRDEVYLRQVREVLSGHVLGSPGGYPVYLKRWSRMGQTRDDSLEQLLLLGEPEAVVAVTGARGLSDELARRAWWTSQDPDNARRMLGNPAVVAGEMGRVLAAFLIEYLPFETEHGVIVESLRLALQLGLVDEAVCEELWKRCQRKPSYYLGFLISRPEDLPLRCDPRRLPEPQRVALAQLADGGNPFAARLLRVFSSAGQGFVTTVLRVMEKPANQDVVTLLLDVVPRYFAELRPQGDPDLDLDALGVEAKGYQAPDLTACLEAVPEYEQALRSIYLLSGLGYGVVRPVFSRTDAIGSLMRRKLQPVLQPLKSHLQALLDTDSTTS